MTQRKRRNRQYRDAIVVDHVRVFIGAVSRAPVLHDAQPPGGNLLVDPMVQQDYAIGDVLFQSVAGQRAVSALSGNDSGKVAVVQPSEKAAEFRAQYRGVG